MLHYKELGLVNSRELFKEAVKGGYAILDANDHIETPVTKRQNGSVHACQINVLFLGQTGSRQTQTRQ